MSRRGTTPSQLPKGAQAVMASRREPPDALDFFPTPPWATRALVEHVLVHGRNGNLGRLGCWEPAAGRGHMSEVLAEAFDVVFASDVFDYGVGLQVGSFTGVGPDVIKCPFQPDWIITNPPFNQAEAFVARALGEARCGAAVLVRTAWLESHGRYDELFRACPPNEVALFVERVPMVKGRWDPEASTATSYAWVIWRKPFLRGPGGTELTWIPPGCREALSRPSDRARFAAETMPDAGDDLFIGRLETMEQA